MDLGLIIGIAIALVLLVGLAIYTGAKKPGSKKDGGTGAAVVTGLIMGTLVGGSSTVGTA